MAVSGTVLRFEVLISSTQVISSSQNWRCLTLGVMLEFSNFQTFLGVCSGIHQERFECVTYTKKGLKIL